MSVKGEIIRDAGGAAQVFPGNAGDALTVLHEFRAIEKGQTGIRGGGQVVEIGDHDAEIVPLRQGAVVPDAARQGQGQTAHETLGELGRRGAGVHGRRPAQQQPEVRGVLVSDDAVMGGLHDPVCFRRSDLSQTGAHVVMAFAGGDEDKSDMFVLFPHETKQFQHFIHALIPLISPGIEEDFVPRGEAEIRADGVAQGRVGLKFFLIGEAGNGKAMFAGGEGEPFLDAPAQGIRDIQNAGGTFQAEPDDDLLEGEGKADGEVARGFRRCVEAFLEFGEGFAADVEEDAGASETEPFEEGGDHGGVAGAGVDDGSAGQASRECEAEEGNEGDEDCGGREGECAGDEGSADIAGDG